jgi:hypothetical protein
MVTFFENIDARSTDQYISFLVVKTFQGIYIKGIPRQDKFLSVVNPHFPDGIPIR